MKKTALLLCMACMAATAFSQNSFPVPSGNVGINLAGSPAYPLDVNGVFSQAGSTFLSYHSPSFNRVSIWGVNAYWNGGSYTVPDNTNNAASIEIHRGASIIRFMDISSGGTPTADHVFSLGGGDSYLNASGGNVGIGTASPSEKLHVNGTTKITGLVSIGTNVTPPGGSHNYMLLVDGKIGAREIKVTATNPWPDYVFNKNYRLPNLYTVERFIQQNRHLPNMPSAQEVKQAGGVDLGSLNAKLLEKVEELTLYMIQLKKENDALKRDNADIRKTLKGLLGK